MFARSVDCGLWIVDCGRSGRGPSWCGLASQDPSPFQPLSLRLTQFQSKPFPSSIQRPPTQSCPYFLLFCCRIDHHHHLSPDNYNRHLFFFFFLSLVVTRYLLLCEQNPRLLPPPPISSRMLGKSTPLLSLLTATSVLLTGASATLDPIVIKVCYASSKHHQCSL